MMQPAAVILAGGMASRMGGGDKGALLLGGQTLLDRIIARIAPQAAALALNANGDAARFASLGLPVLPDPLKGQPGPLAGILAAMHWAAAQGATHVVTVPSDTPFVPCDLIPRLLLAAETAPLAIAASGGRMHPTCALWPTALAEDLRVTLAAGQRKVMDYASRHGAAQAEFGAGPPDPFYNINTPADLAQAEGWI